MLHRTEKVPCALELTAILISGIAQKHFLMSVRSRSGTTVIGGNNDRSLHPRDSQGIPRAFPRFWLQPGDPVSSPKLIVLLPTEPTLLPAMRLVPAALGVLALLQWLSSVRADPLDGLQQIVLNGQTVGNTSQKPTPFRVAVIGAGAAGSSAAWWLHLASERLGQPIEVDVFERAHYIGGRR
jgi:hypothetical protein